MVEYEVVYEEWKKNCYEILITYKSWVKC